MSKDKKKKDVPRSPARWLLWLLYPIAKVFCKCYLGWKCVKDPKIKELKGSVVCIGTHTFAPDVALMILAMLPRRLNIVCGKDVFSWSFVKPIRRQAGLIPINQCSVDLSSIRMMKKAVDNGCSLALFPEGKITLDGRPLPNNSPSIAKLLKVLGRPVVFSHNNGGYCTRPRWFGPFKRGVVEQEIKVLFTEEEIKSLSPEEILARLRDAFQFNDTRWAREKGIRYRSKTPAKGLHYILYKCPKCGAEYEMESDDRTVFCHECGYRVELTDTYELKAVEGETIYDGIDTWYDYETDCVKQEIADPAFRVSHPVVWEECDENYNYVEVGEGELYVDKQNIGFIGKRFDGTPVEMKVDLTTINTVVQKLEEAIDLTVGGVVNRFYFREGKYSAKYNLYVQEIHATLQK